MTRRDYQHWKSFAVRMARTCYAASAAPPGRWVGWQVRGFFAYLEDADQAWDPGLIRRLRDWEHTATAPGEERHGGTPLCDVMADFLNDVWCYDADSGFTPRQGEPEDDARERWEDDYGGAVRCCVRAGLDVLTGQLGVLGFTVGEIRRMYPRGLPAWFRRLEWQDREGNAVAFEALPETDTIGL